MTKLLNLKKLQPAVIDSVVVHDLRGDDEGAWAGAGLFAVSCVVKMDQTLPTKVKDYGITTQMNTLAEANAVARHLSAIQEVMGVDYERNRSGH